MAAARFSIAPISLAEWHKFDAAHPAATFFCRPMFARAIAAAFPTLVPNPLRISLDHAQVILPSMFLASSRWFPWRRLYSMPFGYYGSLISTDGMLSAHMDSEALNALVDSGIDSFEYTQWPISGTSVASTHRFRVVDHETSVIDLRPGAETALARFKSVARRMVGQSSRRGITCARVTAEEGLDAYYAILCGASARWGLNQPPFSREFILAILRFGGSEAELWLVRHDNEAIAGGVVLYGSTELFFLTAAMRYEFSSLRPSNALNAALIRAATERGMQWYNLGSSEGVPNVLRFKQSLGAVPYRYATVQYESPPLRAYLRVRNTLMKRSRLTPYAR